MFTKELFIDSVFDYIESRKLVAKLGCEKEDVKTIFDAIFAVNSVDEFTFTVGNTRLSEVYLPKWVAPFVYPPRVSLLPGFNAADLVQRPKVGTYVYDESEVRKAAYRISASQKKQPEFERADQLRGDVATLSNVKFEVKGKTFQLADELFIPIPLVSTLESHLGGWSNAEADVIIRQYLMRVFSI